MASSHIITLCFSRVANLKFLLWIIHNLSNIKFSGEIETTIIKNTLHFLETFYCFEVNYEDVACRLFILILEGRVKQWFYTFLNDSIHSFKQIFMEIHQAFDRYDYQSVYKKIIHLRMKSNESLEDFLHHFLPFFY